ncbi:MAG TPA: iron ABC transporter, partial [Bacteroidales bacterium]|nr:iron ABC transporter [Bacteroidales bacterium]
MGKATESGIFTKRNIFVFSLLGLLLLISFILNLLLGSIHIPTKEALQVLFGNSENELWRTILFNFRLPKSITAIVAGAALSVSGLQMQTTFRNPLAGPHVLGIKSWA